MLLERATCCQREVDKPRAKTRDRFNVKRGCVKQHAFHQLLVQTVAVIPSRANEEHHAGTHFLCAALTKGLNVNSGDACIRVESNNSPVVGIDEKRRLKEFSVKSYRWFSHSWANTMTFHIRCFD